MEKQSPPVVIMLDGYEVLANSLQQGGLADVEDGWIWDRSGMMWSLPNVLWVIAGRNKLVWDQYDSEIRDSLEQHLLGNISEKDTEGFLSLSGIREESLYHMIYQLTEGTPVYLDMCVNTYRQLKAVRGAEYIPTAEDFGNSPTALAERFLRGMNSEHQRIVKLISCLSADRMTVRILPCNHSGIQPAVDPLQSGQVPAHTRIVYALHLQISPHHGRKTGVSFCCRPSAMWCFSLQGLISPQ